MKIAVGADISSFPKKSDLASLKSEIYKLDIANWETAPVDLSKLSDAVKDEVTKRTVYDELVKKKLMLFKLLIQVT